MNRMRALSVVFGCCFLVLTASTLGQATLYTIPGEHTVTECDEIIEFEVWTDSSNGVAVRAWQVWFDCFGPAPTPDAPCPAAGSVDYVLTPQWCDAWYDCCPIPGCDECIDGFCVSTLAGPFVYWGPDYIFYGISHQVPTEHPGECDIVDPPYDPFLHGTRAANAANNPWEFPVVSSPKYLCTWHFQVSHDACGDFVIDWYCDADDGCPGDRTGLWDGTNTPITPLVSTPLVVHVPCGQCCDWVTCVGEMNQCLCEEQGYEWDGNKTCADPCKKCCDCDDGMDCTIDYCIGTDCRNDPVDCSAAGDDCHDAYCVETGGVGIPNCWGVIPFPDGTPCGGEVDLCTMAACVDGWCQNAVTLPRPYADVFPVPVGDGAVEIMDTLCILDAAGGTGECLVDVGGCILGDIFPCPPPEGPGPDGAVEIMDTLAVLDAAGGNPACAPWCPGVPPVTVFIPGSEFEMGDSLEEGSSDELPVHTVYLSPYYMDRHEVSNEQYAAALNWAYAQGNLINVSDGVVYKYGGTSYEYCDTTTSSSNSRITWNGSTFGVTVGKENHPMVQVSWYGAAAFCNWRSAMEGKPLCYNLSTWSCNVGAAGYRLPTEAEWEKAAGWDPVQERHFRFGEHTDGCGYDCLDGQRANYYDSGDPFESGPDPCTTPVGYYDGTNHAGYQTQNARSYYGCYDMSGNVFEWCNDWYLDTYYSSSPGSNPTGPASGTYRILRGGGWLIDPHLCRSAFRAWSSPGAPGLIVGFRCAVGTP